ncbi:Protein piccolo [Bagarius yarrelli]|uniref:Protein piccolo n=1 Tax=Bagarius yarrelli TaxID=175774 RepID=A0A556TW55_BAGYA|nr:Protein piccolo [Bagarius yarrelli]
MQQRFKKEACHALVAILFLHIIHDLEGSCSNRGVGQSIRRYKGTESQAQKCTVGRGLRHSDWMIAGSRSSNQGFSASAVCLSGLAEEPAHLMPAKSKSAYLKPAKPELAHHVPAMTDPAHLVPGKPEPAGLVCEKPELAHLMPVKPAPAHPVPAKPEPA